MNAETIRIGRVRLCGICRDVLRLPLNECPRHGAEGDETSAERAEGNCD